MSGTVSYMPLETMTRTVGAHVNQDVYSLAVTVYRICGRTDVGQTNVFCHEVNEVFVNVFPSKSS